MVFHIYIYYIYVYGLLPISRIFFFKRIKFTRENRYFIGVDMLVELENKIIRKIARPILNEKKKIIYLKLG